MTSTKHRSIIQISAVGTRARDGVWVSEPQLTGMSPNQWRCREDKAAQGQALIQPMRLLSWVKSAIRMHAQSGQVDG